MLIYIYYKCNLLITNHDEDVSIKLGKDIITGKNGENFLE